MNNEKNSKAIKALPIKRIERLIRLATEHNLACLEVDNIRIIPTPKAQDFASKLNELTYGSNKAKALTERQKSDAMLFGIDGVIEESNGN